MKKLFSIIKSHPKYLFVVDAIGAIVSAFLLFFVLRTFYQNFGISKTALNKLSLIAFLFSIYSASCFFLLKNIWKPFLFFIGFLNLGYCFLTSVVVLDNYQTITMLGFTYFVTEIILILLLAIVELKSSRNN